MIDESYHEWVRDHGEDYAAVVRRVNAAEDVFYTAPLPDAADLLANAYVFAVLSIRTKVERQEQGFTAFVNGAPIEEATGYTTYHNQKAAWMRDTFDTTDWLQLTDAVSGLCQRSQYERALEAVEDSLKGVSYRKAGYVLAMCGVDDLLCVDSHIARVAGYDEKQDEPLDFRTAEEYLDAVDRVAGLVDIPWPPFIIQWSLFDWDRGEHVTHLPFYRTVLEDPLDP